MNTGKSTFLNYLIHLNGTLEIDSQIATKFVCIIRHNKKNKTPLIYETKVSLRGNGKVFNFEKGKKLGKKNIKSIISKRNKEIREKPNSNLNPLIYFLIIELNIPLFKGEFEKYGDLFEFMNIPGLNEISDGNNDNDNFFKEVIPIISPNIKFSILVFDCLKFDEED